MAIKLVAYLKTLTESWSLTNIKRGDLNDHVV
jgi:hypothetical protein